MNESTFIVVKNPGLSLIFNRLFSYNPRSISTSFINLKYLSAASSRLILKFCDKEVIISALPCPLLTNSIIKASCELLRLKFDTRLYRISIPSLKLFSITLKLFAMQPIYLLRARFFFIATIMLYFISTVSTKLSSNLLNNSRE